jgi:hypothetical protein
MNGFPLRWIILVMVVGWTWSSACSIAQDATPIPNDGTTDASGWLQSAIDAGTGAVHLKRGTYLLSKTLVVDLKKTGFTSISGDGVATLKMTGTGPAILVLGNHSGSADPKSFQDEVWQRQRMPLIDGLEIIGSHAESDGIQANGTMQLTITRTTIRDCRHGIHLVRLNRNILISDCHIYKNSGIGIYYDQVNLHQSNIIGCHISYCRGGGIVSHAGNVRNVQIGTCDIEANMASDMPTANIWLDSTGGSIGEVAITGCTIQHSSKSQSCANIRIQGAGVDASLERRAGRPHTREGNVTIGSNVFSDVGTNIHVQDSRGVVITGNTFWEGFDQDLLVERSSNVVVGLNNFDRNPRYLVNGFNNAEKNGVLFRDCDDCMFHANSVVGVERQAAAVQFTNCKRCNISNNSILDCDGVGLKLDNVASSVVNANMVMDDREEQRRTKSHSIVLTKSPTVTLNANTTAQGIANE